METRKPVPPLTGEREDASAIERESKITAQAPELDLLFHFPTFTVVINRYRQIVWANRAALAAFGAASLRDVAGKRPGEALGCIYSDSRPGGCGTTEFCSFCGAARSLAAALEGSEGGDECVIRRDDIHNFESLELMVWTWPLRLADEEFIAFAARDLSAQKRREALERVFYHDILNTVSSLRSLASLLRESAEPEFSDYLGMAEGEADRLTEEIESQRSIKAAEDGDLILTLEDCDADALLDEALHPFLHLFRLRKVNLERGQPAPGPDVRTDKALARRIVVNMIKNALEASKAGDGVYAEAVRTPEGVEFRVRNAGVLTEEQRRRIFHHSFSTKGPGRGLGTYGMKLLGERYLKGRVGFDTEEGKGTTFRLFLPSGLPE